MIKSSLGSGGDLFVETLEINCKKAKCISFI